MVADGQEALKPPGVPVSTVAFFRAVAGQAKPLPLTPLLEGGLAVEPVRGCQNSVGGLDPVRREPTMDRCHRPTARIHRADQGFCHVRSDRSPCCLVAKRLTVESFPKGPRRRECSEPVLRAAMRHWNYEAGLASTRLSLLRHCHVDDLSHRCRYLIAEVQGPARGRRELDSEGKAWVPPAAHDGARGPIIMSRRVLVDEATDGPRTNASPHASGGTSVQASGGLRGS